MTPEEIRQMDVDDAESTNRILRELTAQLAEMNQRAADTAKLESIRARYRAPF